MKIGHNERALSMDIIASRGQRDLRQVSDATKKIAKEWVFFGQKMLEAKELFGCDADFDRWFQAQGFGVSTKKRDAAMWGAQNEQDFIAFYRDGVASTPQSAMSSAIKSKSVEPLEWVYVLTNPAMPGLVKIGKTSECPKHRAKQLSWSTALPAPFEVHAQFETPNADAVEARVHIALEESRFAKNREFFQVSVEQACAAIDREVGNA